MAELSTKERIEKPMQETEELLEKVNSDTEDWEEFERISRRIPVRRSDPLPSPSMPIPKKKRKSE